MTRSPVNRPIKPQTNKTEKSTEKLYGVRGVTLSGRKCRRSSQTPEVSQSCRRSERVGKLVRCDELGLVSFRGKMAKEAKVRSVRSEEDFIGREGEKGEVSSRRSISRPFDSRRFTSEPRAQSWAVRWESFLHHLTGKRIRWEVIIT